MRVMVTGGAGFIGSVVAAYLHRAGHQVVVYDNLSRSERSAVPAAAEFVEGDIAEQAKLEEVLRRRSIQAVMHCSAYMDMGESMRMPETYFRNNTVCTLSLLEAMVRTGVTKLVFSSTAAVYGEQAITPIPETAILKPNNSFGESILMVELMLAWFHKSHQMQYASLRYFNAAGAEGTCGENHQPETHLIPLVLDVALGKRTHVAIFGMDYPTPDGTCVRDYIHVSDVARAHVLALEKLTAHDKLIYNLGNGNGFSVLQVIQEARKITGHRIPCIPSARRAGDAAVLVASSEKIRLELGWKPVHTELSTIIRHAWEYRSERQDPPPSVSDLYVSKSAFLHEQ